MCRSRKTLCWSVGALHARCVSGHLPKNGVLGVHTSGGQKEGSRIVLNRNSTEDKVQQIQDAGFCSKVMASVFWARKEILLVEFLERGATNSSEWYVQNLKKKNQNNAFEVFGQKARWFQPSFLQSWFRNRWLPSSWPCEVCAPRMPFFDWRRAEIQRVWRAPALQERVLRDQYRASQAKVENVC